MITRTLTATVLVAGAAFLCLPAQASTGAQNGSMESQGAQQSPAAASTVDSGTTVHQQAQRVGLTPSHLRGDAAERQMTQCLNNAASQQQPLSTCHR